MADLKEGFRKWLIRQGLSEKTSSGRPGTVYEYVRRIDKISSIIYKGHNVQPWQQLAENIYPILGFHQLCRKGDVYIVQKDVANIKDFLDAFLSSLSPYEENLNGYLDVKLQLNNGNFVERYTQIKDLLPYLTTETLIVKFGKTTTQINKNRNALERFYQFLTDIQYTNPNSGYYKNLVEKPQIDDFYNNLKKRIQLIKSFGVSSSDVLELSVDAGNSSKPPSFKPDKNETEVSSAWVCAILRIERHTLSKIETLRPTDSSKRRYLISEVNAFISKNFVSSGKTATNPIDVKKWWTVREAIENTGLNSKQIQRLRNNLKVSHIKITDKIYIFYPYDFSDYAKKSFTVSATTI